MQKSFTLKYGVDWNFKMKNNMFRAISDSGGIVICSLDSSEIVREMEHMHKPSAVVTAGLGRLLTGASLMGSWLKNVDDSMTLRMEGGGPAGTILAVTDGDGNVRGYATNNVVELPLRHDGKLDVGSALGKNGTLSVIKDLGLKEPYIGRIPLLSGEVAEDITSYYAQSEQTPTVCALGVLVNKDLSVACAGGYLLQLLPGASEDEISQIEQNIQMLPAMTDLLHCGGTPLDVIEMASKGFKPEILEEKRVEYRCYCSREKTEDILIGLGKDEILSMIKEGPSANVECHFCNKAYSFELAPIAEKLGAN